MGREAVRMCEALKKGVVVYIHLHGIGVMGVRASRRVEYMQHIRTAANHPEGAILEARV